VYITPQVDRSNQITIVHCTSVQHIHISGYLTKSPEGEALIVLVVSVPLSLRLPSFRLSHCSFAFPFVDVFDGAMPWSNPGQCDCIRA